MDRTNTPTRTEHPAPESFSNLPAPAHQSPAGKVFWLCATRRRPGCTTSDHARVLLRAEEARPRFDVQIFADADTPPELLCRRARQAREAIFNDAPSTWRPIEPWLARRIEYVWVNAAEPIVTVEDLLLAIMDAFPIPEEPQL